MASELGWPAGLLSVEKRLAFVPSSNTKAFKAQAGVPGKSSSALEAGTGDLGQASALLCCTFFFSFIKAQQRKFGLEIRALSLP